MDTASGIGRDFSVLGRFVRIDSLDEADSSDGNEVVGHGAFGIVFFDYVGDESQVVLDEFVAGLFVAGEKSFYTRGFFLRAQRVGKDIYRVGAREEGEPF